MNVPPEVHAYLLDVVRYDEAEDLLTLLAELAAANGKRANIGAALVEALGDIPVGVDEDDKPQTLAELKDERDGAREETQGELDDANEEIDRLKLRVDELKEEMDDMRKAQEKGEPLPPRKPEPPDPATVAKAAASEVHAQLLAIADRYRTKSEKAGQRSAAGKALATLTSELGLLAYEAQRKTVTGA